MPNNELIGKIVVVTGLRVLPKSCGQCKFYENMGGTPGRSNNGACRALNYWSTRSIAVSKDRLPNCPLRMIGR